MMYLQVETNRHDVFLLPHRTYSEDMDHLAEIMRANYEDATVVSMALVAESASTPQESR